MEVGAEITPEGAINAGQSLSQPAADSSLYTREPLGTGDADCHNQRPKFRHEIWLAMAAPQPRRPCGPPRNDKRFLSFRGAERRGNPSFFTRWTGGRAAEVVGPYEWSTEVPAPGRCGHRPLRKARSTTQASRRAAKRPRPRGRGMGGNRCKGHPKRGTAAATAQAALSEAESAERVAGQIRVLPDDLRVQHGVRGSEVLARPRPCSRRDCDN